MFAAIKIGTFGLLLPVYFTVSHRMFPFFAGNVVKGYKPWRPIWLLGPFWPLTLAHLALELVHGYQWLCTADVPLLALASTWPSPNWRLGHVPALLRVLFPAYPPPPLSLALDLSDLNSPDERQSVSARVD